MKRYLHIPVAAAVGALAMHAIITPAQPQIVLVKEPVYEQVSSEYFAKNEARKLAWELLTRQNFRCFDYVLQRESNWRSHAKNKGSSARGVGQLLSSTYRNLGMKHSTDPRAQVTAALAYIGRKYGSGGPCAAKRHWIKHGWY